jgi:multiple sugar transport system permease protein
MSGGMSGGISGPIRRSASVRRLVAIGVTLIVLLSPFLWLLQMSFKSNDLILQFPPPLIFTPYPRPTRCRDGRGGASTR